MAAAQRLFLRHGFSRTSMDAIAAEAGVSKQTVYSYFRCKDDLFCEMIAQECQRHAPGEALLEGASLTLDEALARIGQGFIDMISSPRGLAIHRLVMEEAPRHPKVARMFYESGPQRMQGVLVRYLQRQAALGVLAIDDADRAASDFFSLVKGRYHLRMQLQVKPLPTAREIAQHLQQTIAVFRKAYKP